MIQTIEPAASGTTTAPASTWTLDAGHSSIHFAGRQMMISTVRGRFARFDAAVTGSETRPEAASVEVTIDAASVDSGVPRRDEHLMSADFLDAATFPTITFRSSSIKRLGDETLQVQGDLTIKGVTRPVAFDATFNGLATGMSGARHAAFSAETKIDRRDWGLTWNMPIGTDQVLVGTDITLQFELTLEEAAAAPTESAAAA